jgi:hypothetical protein
MIGRKWLNRPFFDASHNPRFAPLRKTEWVVYAKRPFAGPAQVLAYLARYTHRVAIANGLAVDDDRVGPEVAHGLDDPRTGRTPARRGPPATVRRGRAPLDRRWGGGGCCLCLSRPEWD